jgi:hypothetical protein
LTRLLICVLLLISTSFPLIADRQACPAGDHTFYSRKAVPLNTDQVVLRSPDMTKLLTVKRVIDPKDKDGMHIQFRLSVNGREFIAATLGFNAEVLWSPNSEAFAATIVEGGGGFGERSYVYYAGENGLRKVDISLPVEKVFRTPGKCEIHVAPNTGIIDWLAGSRQLLAAAEVVPVSACECMGTYKVFAVNLSDLSIDKSFTEREAQSKLWPFLGCELGRRKNYRRFVGFTGGQALPFGRNVCPVPRSEITYPLISRRIAGCCCGTDEPCHL